MISTWYKGLTPAEKTVVVADFKGSAIIRKRLEELLNAKVVTARRDVLTKDGYRDASWAYRQADAIGYERAINEVISLISSDSVEEVSKKG